MWSVGRLQLITPRGHRSGNVYGRSGGLWGEWLSVRLPMSIHQGSATQIPGGWAWLERCLWQGRAANPQHKESVNGIKAI